MAEIQGNSVTLKSGAKVDFPFPVGNAIDFDDITVIRLEVPRDVRFNENVFGVAPNRRIIWQIRQEFPATRNVAWAGLEKIGGQAMLSNSESQMRWVNPETGEITRREVSMR